MFEGDVWLLSGTKTPLNQTSRHCTRAISHSRGAPEVPESPPLGAQYITRYNTKKKFVRVTRPAPVCPSPKMNTTRNIFIPTGSSSLKELEWPDLFDSKKCKPYRVGWLSYLAYTWYNRGHMFDATSCCSPV